MHDLPISLPDSWRVITAFDHGEELEYVFRHWPRSNTYVGVRLSTLPQLNDHTYHLKTAMVVEGPTPPPYERHVMSYNDREDALTSTEQFVHLLDDHIQETVFTKGTFASDVLPTVVDEFAPEGPPQRQPLSEKLRRILH